MGANITNEEMLEILMQRLDNREDDYFNAITELKSDVKEIKAQTIKTNSRVNLLEYKHDNCNIKEVANETEIVRMIFRYPKLTKSVFLFFIAIMLGSGILSIIKLFV